MNEKYDVSIIIPCYNEEDHLRENFRELERTMAATRYAWEVIFVDDCSGDGTRGIIEELARGRDNVRYVFHEKNKGRGGAVKTGAAVARANIAGFLDIDLEVHCRYIPSMVQAIQDGADVACGYRIYRITFSLDDIFRNVLSVGYRVLTRRLLRLQLKDSEAGYKFFNLYTTRPLLAATENDGWFWDTEIMAQASYRGYRIANVPMAYIRRPDKVSTVKPISDALKSFRALLAFRRRYAVGFVYRSSRMYHTAMKRLYHNNYDERYAAIGENIPVGSSVVDVCCGDGMLYDAQLSKKNVQYIGLDINSAFAASAAARGVDVRGFDIELRSDVPQADTVVMQSSLYQFIPRHCEILDKLMSAARRQVIISEPISNMASSSNPALKWLAKKGTNPGTGPKTERFNAKMLEECLSPYKVVRQSPICNGREMLFVIEKMSPTA